ncbi:DUF3592 domain-containing protein [uncultured Pseudodesulfovibrio sp.]|uniref:DUF3592 domain-containing protein n=1 Tax=uncultured Pseudodesulfovibrio sp. TaxID=2035858 RepID=UPI0029C732D9|nr:DUF3592 domain-containing protein [uncultured Pseudodesulfovibrio sp.]
MGMIFTPGRHPQRTPAQKFFRVVLGLAAVTLICVFLYHVPYDVLREERLRLYGEDHTTGLVIAVSTTAATSDGSRYTVDYKYVDNDGFVRQASAFLPHDVWKRYRPGDRIEVMFASGHPDLSRVRDEIEPAFQEWLRRMLD